MTPGEQRHDVGAPASGGALTEEAGRGRGTVAPTAEVPDVGAVPVGAAHDDPGEHAAADARPVPGRRLVVLSSLRAVRPTTNPYLLQLDEHLGRDVDVLRFSWRTALLGRFDVLHVHWPEVLVTRRTRPRTLAAVLALGLVLLRLRVSGRALVRTVHNVEPHERPWLPVCWALRWCDAATRVFVRLNDRTPVPPDRVAVTIPHGSYVDWYAGRPHAEPVPGRLLFFGLVRPYKGIEGLLDAFGALDDPHASLRVAGNPSDAGLAATIVARCAADPRVSADLRHLSDDELSLEVGRAALVVLPYTQMHNSGAALLALSLGRPVLVPDTAVNRDLAAEVGAGWVQLVDGPLDAGALRRALDAVAELRGQPDLSRREWPEVARLHLEVLTDAARPRRARAGSRPARRRSA